MTATRDRDARLTAGHLVRSVIVYIRQSSEMQVRNNLERRKLQYALADHARALGFAKVELIDDDLGISGDGVPRPGFERLLQAVCSDRVGPWCWPSRLQGSPETAGTGTRATTSSRC